jgi:hypothetical protein
LFSYNLGWGIGTVYLGVSTMAEREHGRVAAKERKISQAKQNMHFQKSLKKEKGFDIAKGWAEAVFKRRGSMWKYAGALSKTSRSSF